MSSVRFVVGMSLAMGCALAFAQQPDPVPANKIAVPEKAAAATAKPVEPPGVSVTERGRGQVFVKETHFEFGFVMQDAKITHIYDVQNVGTDTLFIERVQPTCGCTSAALANDKLAPGDHVPVEITFSTKKYSGPVSKTVYVISSDSTLSKYPLEFSATVGGMPPTVGLVPETGIDFDRFEMNQHREAKVTLTNYSPDAVALSIVGVPESYLAAHFSRDKLEPRQTADLIVDTRDGAPLGKFSGAITIALQGAQTTRLTIPVNGVSMMK